MKLKYSFCAGLAAMLFMLPACGNGSLKDITKPYLGEYECKNATLGERDYVEEFSFIRLELKRTTNLRYLIARKTVKKGKRRGRIATTKKKKRSPFLMGISVF